MMTRTQFERRCLPPGTRLTETQWAHLLPFVAADHCLDALGAGSGRTFLRAALVRFLLDRDDDLDAAAPDARDRTATALVAGPGIGHVDAQTAAARHLVDKCAALDARAGRTRETTPPHVLSIADRVLADRSDPTRPTRHVIGAERTGE